MQEIKPFQKKAFVASTQYDAEFSSRPIMGVGIRFAASVAGAAATIRDDAAFRLLSTPEVNQAENPIVRMRGPSWRHMSAILDGSYDEHTATAALAVAHAFLNFEKMFPGALINASDKKVFVRGEFSKLEAYSGTAPTGVTGDLKPYVITSERDPTKGFLRPRITEKTIPITAAGDDQQDTIRFEQDMIVAGLMITCDNSTTGNPRTDGLVKNLRFEHVGREGGSKEIQRASWGQYRALLQNLSNFNPEDYARSAGVILVPFKSRVDPRWGGGELFRAGSSLVIHLDSSSTVEPDFTAATIAAGAQAVVTLLGATPVAGTGDAAAQLTQIAAPQGRAVQGLMNSRQKRRLSRAGVS